MTSPYGNAAALIAAVREGDVLLLSGRWIMARAGYEEVEMEYEGFNDDGNRGLFKAKKWEERGGRLVLPLPSRQEIEADHRDAILDAADLERIHAQLKRRRRDGRAIDFDAAPIVSTSYCWEGVESPDEQARTLRKLAAALRGEWSYGVPKSGLPLYAAWGFEDVGVFFDFASLYQNKPTPRTPTQQQSFQRALCAPPPQARPSLAAAAATLTLSLHSLPRACSTV